MKPVLGFVLIALLPVSGRAQDVTQPRQFQRTAISVVPGPSPHGIEVSESWLSTEPEGILETEISTRNQTGKSLSLLTIMVNYLDERGSIAMSIPYQANLENERNRLRNVHSFSEIHLAKPIQPGGELNLTDTNLLCLTKVPASAEVAFWLAEFEDGSSVSDRIGQRGFRTDPLLMETPGHLRVPLRHPDEPIEILVKLQISEYGKVLNVESAQAGDSGLSKEQFQALSQQLAEWRFFPAVENGYGAKSNLDLLVVFLPENALRVKRRFSDHPGKYPTNFGLVTLQPVRATSDSWIPYYGGFPARAKWNRMS